MGWAILVLAGLGLAAAAVLAAASKIFYVYVDPKIEAVEDALAGANCGGCGAPGCSAAAEMIVAGKLPVTACVAGGEEVAEEVAAVMGVEMEFKEPEISECGCRGGVLQADRIYEYSGVKDCRAVDMLAEGDSICTTSCLGYGTCVRACPFDAMTQGEDLLPKIDFTRCVGCGVCEEICPHDAVKLVSESRKLLHWLEKDECSAPCQTKCPAQIDIPSYIFHIRNKRYADALDVIREHNPLPITCGYVCPHPCEEVCRRLNVDEPVAINDLKRFVADYELDDKGKSMAGRLSVLPDTGKKVAIMGGGPAGLSAAYFLRRLGHSPTIFERMPKLGGALEYGIPEYRLPKARLAKEIQGILDLGVETRLQTELGKDVTMESLKEEGFDVFLLAGGTPTGFYSGTEGEDLEGILLGIDFLRDYALGKDVPLGERVLVVGGGNVAVDVSLTVKRLGIPIVYQASLEDRWTMPAWEHEIQDVLVQGVNLIPTWGLKRFIGKNGKLTAVEMQRCECVFDEEGRFNPQYDCDQTMNIAIDNALITIGQGVDTEFMKSHPILKNVLDSRGKVDIDSATMQTNVDYIFAAGEIVTGPGLAIEAIGAGRKAAVNIHRYLTMEQPGKVEPLPRLLGQIRDYADEEELAEIPKEERQRERRLPPEKRQGFDVVNLGFTEEQALKEAGRCLQCGMYCFINPRTGHEKDGKQSEAEGTAHRERMSKV